MILKKPEQFYKLYPYHYWLLKAETIKGLLDNNSTFQDSEGILEAHGADQKNYQNMLKYELHFTYFQQIEALFELIFALEKQDNKYLWLILSESYKHQRRYSKKIEQLANGSEALLDKKIELTDGCTINFYKWLLYAATDHELNKEEVDITVKKTHELVLMAAKDFNDRGQYRAFKHGMRVLPAWTNFSITKHKSNDEILSFDLSNSFTYLNIPADREKVEEVTIGYNSKRDIKKISLITMLMSGIIESRKGRFFGEGKIVHFVDFDLDEFINKEKISMQKMVVTHRFNKKTSDD